MNKVLCLLMCTAVIFTSRCSDTGFSRDAKTDVVYSNSDIAIEIASVSSSEITLSIENKTDSELGYDEYVYIERKNETANGKEWFGSDKEDGNVTDIYCQLPSNTTNTFTYSFENITSSGTLSSGEYRVVKPVDTTSGTVNLAVDFEITE